MCGEKEEAPAEPAKGRKSGLRQQAPYHKICPMCNNVHSIMLNQPERFMVEQYEKGNSPIQTALSFLNAGEKEFVKTGYCGYCQSLLFGNSLLADSPRYS